MQYVNRMLYGRGKSKNYIDMAKSSVGLGVGSMAGGAAIGAMGAVPGMPASGIAAGATAMSAVNLANVGNLANIGMNIIPGANTKPTRKKAKKHKWM